MNTENEKAVRDLIYKALAEWRKSPDALKVAQITGYEDAAAFPQLFEAGYRAALQSQSNTDGWVAKGDPRDVANYCAFLWWHGASTTPPQQQEQSGEAVAWIGEQDIITQDKARSDYWKLQGWKCIPLYLAPPTSTAIAAMVIKQASECITSTFNEIKFKDNDTQLCVKAALGDALLKLRALPGSSKALEDFGYLVARAVEYAPAPKVDTGFTDEEIREIVQSVIRKG